LNDSINFKINNNILDGMIDFKDISERENNIY